ncbi:apolipoprotein N-acyltransferase [Thiotrichales bacterium 19X7-9]|nr:apolipoprotein N-acyltransferase [Thiotrichales bacterium 19X7-9]
MKPKTTTKNTKNNKLKFILSSIIAFICGAILTLAFAPFHIWIIAFISLIVLFYLWSGAKTGKYAFYLGYLFGLGNFGTGISWVYVSIHTYGNTSTPLAVFITLLFIMVLSLFPAIVGFLNQKLCSKEKNAYQLCFIYPATWTLFEWIRSWVFTGFPWLFVGYTQTDTYLGGLAEAGSVYLVSFAVCLCASALIMFIRTKRNSARCIAIFIIIVLWALGWFFLQDQQWTIQKGKPLSVSLIQGNIKPTTKWDPEHLKYIQKTYLDLTEKHPADLIFWPENSIPNFPMYVAPYIKNLNQFAINHNSAILLGMPLGNPYGKYYNGAIVVGYGYGEYKKQHLVPFGEYLPLRSIFLPIMTWMDQPMSEFTEGPTDQGTVTMQNMDVALFICYEIAFPSLVRKDAQTANLIATITDDGWFGKTIAPWQHLQITHMRSIELGKSIIQATNDGVTAIITPNKVITYPPFKRGVLEGTVYAMEGQTPWVRYGMTPVLMLIFLSLILGLVVRRRQKD